jgi:asparagine synthase (glutamine-hydrolysing)
LRRAGYFDPKAVARERWLQTHLPRITPRRFVFDLGLTSVVSTQLWHHLFCGGGLCELPVWTPPTRADLPLLEVAATEV